MNFEADRDEKASLWQRSLIKFERNDVHREKLFWFGRKRRREKFSVRKWENRDQMISNVGRMLKNGTWSWMGHVIVWFMEDYSDDDKHLAPPLTFLELRFKSYQQCIHMTDTCLSDSTCWSDSLIRRHSHTPQTANSFKFFFYPQGRWINEWLSHTYGWRWLLRLLTSFWFPILGYLIFSYQTTLTTYLPWHFISVCVPE